MRPRITVRIDELVLDGVQAGAGVGESVRTELTRLLAQQPAPPPASRGVIRAGALPAGPVGPAIARAVHRGLRS